MIDRRWNLQLENEKQWGEYHSPLELAVQSTVQGIALMITYPKCNGEFSTT